MAIGYMWANQLRRGEAGGFVAAVAYSHGIAIENPRTGERCDHSDHGDVDRAFVIPPEGAPPWAHDAVEVAVRFDAAARQYNAREGWKLCAALPNELSIMGQDRVVDRFCKAVVEEHGVIAVGAIHGRRNQSCRGFWNCHVHLQVTNKPPLGDTFGTVVRSMDRLGLYKRWRQLWQDVVNGELAREGHAARIDMRSYAERGVDLEPQIHEGEAAIAEHARTSQNPRVLHNIDVRHRNALRLGTAKPNALLHAAIAQTPPSPTDVEKAPVGAFAWTPANGPALAIPQARPAAANEVAAGMTRQKPEPDGLERVPQQAFVDDALKGVTDIVRRATTTVVDQAASLLDAAAQVLRDGKRKRKERREWAVFRATSDLQRFVRLDPYSRVSRLDLSDVPANDPLHRHHPAVLKEAKREVADRLAVENSRRADAGRAEFSQRLADEMARRREVESERPIPVGTVGRGIAMRPPDKGKGR